MQDSHLVFVDADALVVFAEQLAEADLSAPEWREPWYPEEDDADFVQFLGVANALNFCYTEPGHEKFLVNWNDMPLGGSAGLMAALQRSREEGIDILDAKILAGLRPSSIANIFRSDAGPLPLLEERGVRMNSLGQTLLDDYDGHILNLFEDCDFRAHAIIETLAEDFLAYSGDAVMFSGGKTIRFDKRPRLLPLMYEGRARSSAGALPQLLNPEAIGPVIDYQVAKTLRANDVLVYTPELDEKIAQGIPLVAWQDEELLIRLAAHDAVLSLLSLVNKTRAERGEGQITMVELDFALWSAGRALKEIPHHLCMTTAY